MKTITNILITHTALLLFFGSIAFVFAQENPVETRTSTNTRPAVETVRSSSTPERARENTNRAEAERLLREQQAERRGEVTERRAALQAQAQTRITNLAANLSNRIEAVLERLTTISVRLEARIEKIAERGVDTTAATAAVASGNRSLEMVRNDIAEIDTIIATVVGSENPRAAWASVRALYTQMRDNLKTAHSEFRAAVTALKSATATQPAPQTDNADSEI